MTTRTISRLTTMVAIAALATACGFESKNTNVLSPSPAAGASANTGGATTSSPSYLGTWSSQSLPGVPDISTCGNLQWTVTSQTATTLAGNFSAVCAGGLTVNGTASGSLNSDGVTIPMSASGTASEPGVAINCAFALNGTGHVQPDNTMLVNYTGTTCLGPVSGSQTLHHAF